MRNMDVFILFKGHITDDFVRVRNIFKFSNKYLISDSKIFIQHLLSMVQVACPIGTDVCDADATVHSRSLVVHTAPSDPTSLSFPLHL
jgi:hypothetical protein